MSLAKRVVSVPIADGLNDADDEWAGEPPGFVELAEARWGRDKQIGKRFGVEQVAVNISGPGVAREPNNVVDLDGIGHLITADGTFRENVAPGADGKWEPMNWGALRPSRVLSDPLVRTDGSLAKSDAAVAGTVVCAVWDHIDGGGAHIAYYGFWDVRSDTPRPISGPHPFALITNGCRVVALNADTFLATGLNAGALYSTVISVASGTTWLFPAPGLVDLVSDNNYGLCADEAAAFAYVAYRDLAGPSRRLKKINSSNVVIANRSLAVAAAVQHVMHNLPLAQVFVIDGGGLGGTVSYCADNLGGAVTNITPFTDPPSGVYTGKFFRASIGRADSSGNMWCARSTSGPYSRTGLPYATQMLRLDGASKVTSGERLIGGVVLTAHFSRFIDAIGTCLVGVGQQGAWYTADHDPTITALAAGDGYRTAPVGYLVQPAFPPGLTITTLYTWGRYGQDAMELFGNQGTGALMSSPTVTFASSHLPHLDTYIAANVPVIVSAYPVRTGVDPFAGSSGYYKRSIDLVRAQVHNVPPVRNVNAQSLRVMGGGAGSYAIDGVSSNELTPPAPEWLRVDGVDASLVGTAYPVGAPPPDIQDHISVAGSPWGGGPNPNRQWGFVVCWQYTDARGNVHRGAPSSICWTLYAELAAAGHPAKLCFAPWNPVSLQGDKTIVEAAVYACPTDGEGDFRLLGVVTPMDDPADEGRVYVALVHGGAGSSYSVDVNNWDGVAAVGVNVSRSLYTTEAGGSELDSWPSPPLLDLCSTESRLWGLNGEDRLDVWYTKPIALGVAPEWNASSRVRVPQDGGPAVAVAAIDDKVVVFKASKVFVIEGDPGDASGAASSLRQPRLVSGDVGCASVNSVVEGPFGVVFQSDKGFVVLDRGLQFTFVGDKVTAQATLDTEALTVVSACLVARESEVRFVLDSGRGGGDPREIVWNYRFNRWARRDGLLPLFSGVVDGREISVKSDVDGTFLARETFDAWDFTPFGVSFRSSWIKLNGIAGYGRVWRVVFVLRWFANGIRIRTAQDYLDSSDSARVWSASEMAALADPTTGRVELVARPVIQKCEAIQLIVDEIGNDGVVIAGRGFELVGVTLEVGVKPTAYKRLPAAARK